MQPQATVEDVTERMFLDFPKVQTDLGLVLASGILSAHCAVDAAQLFHEGAFAKIINKDVIDYGFSLPQIRCVSSVGLDLEFPYPHDVDNPYFGLTKLLPKLPIRGIDVVRLFTAKTYLMWVSNVPNSIPVPLGYLIWGFSESAHYTPLEGWSLSQVTFTPLPPNGMFTANIKEYPLWSNPAIISPPCTLASQ